MTWKGLKCGCREEAKSILFKRQRARSKANGLLKLKESWWINWRSWKMKRINNTEMPIIGEFVLSINLRCFFFLIKLKILLFVCIFLFVRKQTNKAIEFRLIWCSITVCQSTCNERGQCHREEKYYATNNGWWGEQYIMEFDWN